MNISWVSEVFKLTYEIESSHKKKILDRSAYILRIESILIGFGNLIYM